MPSTTSRWMSSELSKMRLSIDSFTVPSIEFSSATKP